MRRHCLFYKRHLSAYIDGELSGDLNTEIKAHLAACPSCRSEAEALSSAMETIATLCVPDPDRRLDKAIMFKVAEQQTPIEWYHSISAPVCSALAGLLIGICLTAGMPEQRLQNTIAADDGIIQAMDVFSPSPRGSFSDAYFAMITEFGKN